MDLDAASVEQLLEELKQVIASLEARDVSIDAAMEAFERGVAITRKIKARLSAAEARVEILSQS